MDKVVKELNKVYPSFKIKGLNNTNFKKVNDSYIDYFLNNVAKALTKVDIKYIKYVKYN